VPITITEAALGATVRIPLLRGSITLKIPPGTSSGAKMRVRGRGIDDAKGGKGDFYAVIAVVAPRDLSPTDAELLRQVGANLPDPRAAQPWAVEDQVA